MLVYNLEGSFRVSTEQAHEYIRKTLSAAVATTGYEPARIRNLIEELKMTLASKFYDPNFGGQRQRLPILSGLTAVSAFSSTMQHQNSFHNTPKWYPSAGRSDKSPREVFHHTTNELFMSRSGSGQMLIYTDGSCMDNGRTDARAGFAFVYRHQESTAIRWSPPPGAYCMNGAVFARLEDTNFRGQIITPTSDRAELRAVICAISHLINHDSMWGVQGLPGRQEVKAIVIATDSTYVCEGITRHIRKWELNDWKLSNYEPVKNRDMWEVLIERMRLLHNKTKWEIIIWHIAREDNQAADAAAKYGASLPARRICGIPCPSTTNNNVIMVDASQLP